MKKGKKFLLIVVILLLAALLYDRWQNISSYKEDESIRNSQKFDRRVSKIKFSANAICRMNCRSVSKTDVEDIMRTGEINYAISNVANKPCPTFALEGYTTANQYIRVIFAQCDNDTEVVNCIDLKKEVECSCPGDEK